MTEGLVTPDPELDDSPKNEPVPEGPEDPAPETDEDNEDET